MESILETVLDALGVSEEDEIFHHEIILAINTAIGTLTQIGLGRSEGFSIRNHRESWEDFFHDARNVEMAKTYVCLKARQLFDPPTTSFLIDAVQKNLDEILWRLELHLNSEEEE